MTVITRAELMQFTPHADGRIADAVVARADAAFRRWEITTTPRMQMFLAQAAVESAWLTVVFESMTYSAERLVRVWPGRFPTIAAAAPYAHNPQALANKVYGGRMGNVGPDDGWLCRGQGLMQTTGLSNFERLAAHMGRTVAEVRAGLTAEDGMVDCAAATFHMLGGNAHADRGEVEGCTRAINGGLNGLADREKAYALAKKVWPAMRALDAPAPVAVMPARPASPAASSIIVAPPRHIDTIAASARSKPWWQAFLAAFKGDHV